MGRKKGREESWADWCLVTDTLHVIAEIRSGGGRVWGLGATGRTGCTQKHWWTWVNFLLLLINQGKNELYFTSQKILFKVQSGQFHLKIVRQHRVLIRSFLLSGVHFLLEWASVVLFLRRILWSRDTVDLSTVSYVMEWSVLLIYAYEVVSYFPF